MVGIQDFLLLLAQWSEWGHPGTCGTRVWGILGSGDDSDARLPVPDAGGGRSSWVAPPRGTPRSMEVIKGIPVSPGVIIGRAFVLDDAVRFIPHRAVAQKDVPHQLERLSDALEQAIKDLEADRDRAAIKLGPEPAKIFEFHLGLLRDPSLITHISEHIERDQVTAEYAVSEEFRKLTAQFRAMDSEVFRQKTGDLLDLDRRVLNKLIGESEDRLARLNEPVVLVAHDITPTRAASLHRPEIIGIATDSGGRTSHASIMAAALGVPVVVGCTHVTEHVDEGDHLLVDEV